MTTSCWGDVVFTEKTFSVVSWMEDLRNSGIRGAEGLEGLEDFFT